MTLKELKQIIGNASGNDDSEINIYVRVEGEQDQYVTKRACFYDEVGLEKYIEIILEKE